MAWMIPSTVPPDATPGERRVFQALQQLPATVTVWYRRLLPGRCHVEEPDFIVLSPDLGLVVLEVKDWRHAATAGGEQDDPLAQAKRYVHTLQDQVRRQGFPVLVHATGPDHRKLCLPCVPAVVFPFISQAAWPESGLTLDPRHVLLQEDLRPANLEQRLRALVHCYFEPRLTPAQVDYLRGLVAPELCLEPPTPTDPPRLLDPDQTTLVLSDLVLPPPGPQLVRDLRVRLVRGVAGSGKTLLLLLRAKLLQALQPAWAILLLTFNKDLATYLTAWYRRLGADPSQITITHFHKWCHDLLEEMGRWRPLLDPDSQQGLLANVQRQVPGAERFPPEFLAAEIKWLKEHMDPLTLEAYRQVARTGRGSRLDAAQRDVLFQVFEHYQQALNHLKRFDWEEVPLQVLRALDEGQLTGPRYHAILVDETQDFAPSWFRVILRMLKPEINLLFLVGDGAQRIYRRDLNWRRLGIPLSGSQSRILRRAYRNTVEIATYAVEFLRKQGAVLEELAQFGETWVEPELDHPWARHGPPPSIHGFATKAEEDAFLVREITTLLSSGYQASDILVLRRFRDALPSLVHALQQAGVPAARVKDEGLILEPQTVNVCTFHSAKGLEFPVVFCGLTGLFQEQPQKHPSPEEPQAQAEEARLLYVGMTRARDRLYLTYHL